jgi:hypothetical protein
LDPRIDAHVGGLLALIPKLHVRNYSNDILFDFETAGKSRNLFRSFRSFGSCGSHGGIRARAAWPMREQMG